MRGEIGDVQGSVTTLYNSTAGAVERMETEGQSFAQEQQLVTALLDAKASELNDKQSALDTMLTNMEASIAKFNEDGRALNTRVDEGLEKTSSL